MRSSMSRQLGKVLLKALLDRVEEPSQPLCDLGELFMIVIWAARSLVPGFHHSLDTTGQSFKQRLQRERKKV